MKVLVTSPMGEPRDPRTWSNAPAHMVAVLEAEGFEVATFHSGLYGKAFRAAMAGWNAVRGYPWRQVAWFGSARRKRAEIVTHEARRVEADLVLSCSSLDVPVGSGIPYALWMDNSWHVLDGSATSPGFSAAASQEIDRLERLALQGAAMVLPFSRHVADDMIEHYGLLAEKVVPVGCGAGPLPPFYGEKSFADGHLMFVAKHLFGDKGGHLLLDAFPMIRQARPQTRLVLIGNEEAKARADGMEGVEVHGFLSREELNQQFYGASMLVQPMLSDPWGQVYLEAMKARAAVVALNIAALPELTDNGRLGVLVEEADARLLADAVLATYERSQQELDAMTREAQANVLREHEWSAVGARTAHALRKVFEMRAAAE